MLERELARLDALAEKHRIRFSLTQLRILFYLNDHPGATFQEVSKALGIQDTRLRDPLDLLCEQSIRGRGNLGLVRRRNTSRSNDFSLTEKGKRALRDL